MSAKMDEVLSFLKELGVEKITVDEKKTLYKKLEKENNVRKLKGELELLFAINQSLIKSYGKVCVTNMLEIYKNIDANLMMNLSTMYELVRVKSKNELAALKSFKEVVLQTLKENEKTNQNVANELDEAMKKSLILKDSLYLTMRSKEQADSLFNNCIRRSKLFIRQCESNNLESIIYCLKKDFSFSDEELVDISKKCASFFVAASVSKINNLHRQIEEFKNYIKDQSAVMSSAMQINKLLEKDFKAVLADASSVATLNSYQINKTIRFLSGEKISGLGLNNKEIVEIQGEFTPLQLAKIYNQSISSLNITVEKVIDVCNNINKVYSDVFKKKLDLNKFINGNNFTSINQLTKEDYLKGGKIKEVFEVLSMFLYPEDMENLLRNNMSFLIAPIEAVKLSLQKAVLESTDKEELRQNVLKKIRNHFDIYEGGFKNVKFDQESSVHVPPSLLGKVGIKNVDENEVKTILEKLETDPEDIEKWANKWNKEEKEYRDLGIQINIENLIAKIKDLDSVSDIAFHSVEQFEEEIDIARYLIKEVEDEYENIVMSNNLNKKFLVMVHKAYHQMQEVMMKVNGYMNSLHSMYKEELEQLNSQLLKWHDSMNELSRKNARVEELDKSILENKISEETNEEKSKHLKDIKRFMDNCDRKVREINNTEKEISGKINKYFLFLETEYKEKQLNINIPSLDQETGSFLNLRRKFYGLINALEAEELIEGYELPYYSNSVKTSYKQYKNLLNDKEREITDEIYNMCVANLKCKEKLKESMKEMANKYNLDDEDKLKTHEKYGQLLGFYDELKDSIRKNKNILKERAGYDKEEIDKKINSLQEEKEKLDKSISECSKKIDELLKKKIRL